MTSPCKAGDGIAGGTAINRRHGIGGESAEISIAKNEHKLRFPAMPSPALQCGVDRVEKDGMTGGKTKQSGGTSVVGRIVVAAVVVFVLGGVGYGYAQRNVYRVSIGPGEATSITVEVPMQRFGWVKSFAKESNLPVRCEVSRPEQDSSDRLAPPATASGTSMNGRWAINAALPRRLHGEEPSPRHSKSATADLPVA